jgi:hypothetical protein
MCHFGYPSAREDRGREATPIVTSRFERYESTDGEVTQADALALVREFSGRADAFYIGARTNGALVQITDRLRRETHEITILAGTADWFYIPGDTVMGRNLVAGSNAALSVTAAFAKAGTSG